MPSGRPPRPDTAARTHRPRGPSGVARGCEALLYPENRRVFRMILAHYLLGVDGKRDRHYRTLQTMVIVGRIAPPLECGTAGCRAGARYVRPLPTGISAWRDGSEKRSARDHRRSARAATVSAPHPARPPPDEPVNLTLDFEHARVSGHSPMLA